MGEFLPNDAEGDAKGSGLLAVIYSVVSDFFACEIRRIDVGFGLVKEGNPSVWAPPRFKRIFDEV